MITRKHYKAIAEIIKIHRQKDNTASWRMIKRLADYFGIDNPQFDRQKFLAACL